MGKPNIFKLGYRVHNCGDGSVSVIFHQTMKEAEKAEDDAIENGNEDGWGENSAAEVELKLENGKLYFLKGEWVEEPKYEYIKKWIEVLPQEKKK